MGALASRLLKRKKLPQLGTIVSAYEEILKAIRSDIEAAKAERAAKRAKHRSCTWGIIKFGAVVYLLLCVFVYLWVPPRDTLLRWDILRVAPLIAFPALLWIVRRAVDAYFVKSVEALEAHIRDLEKLNAEKLNDFKAATNFDEVRKIFSTYGDASFHGMAQSPQPNKRANTERKQPGQQGDPRTPANAKPTTKASSKSESRNGRQRPQAPPPRGETIQYPNNPRILKNQQQHLQQQQRQMQQGALGQVPMGLVNRTVRDAVAPKPRVATDKVVDYLLGDGPNNRYALICRTCFTHNGMVLPEDAKICYRCGYCNALNGEPPKRDPAQEKERQQRIQQHLMLNQHMQQQQQPPQRQSPADESKSAPMAKNSGLYTPQPLRRRKTASSGANNNSSNNLTAAATPNGPTIVESTLLHTPVSSGNPRDELQTNEDPSDDYGTRNNANGDDEDEDDDGAENIFQRGRRRSARKKRRTRSSIDTKKDK